MMKEHLNSIVNGEFWSAAKYTTDCLRIERLSHFSSLNLWVSEEIALADIKLRLQSLPGISQERRASIGSFDVSFDDMCARVEQISRARVGLGGVSEKHAIRINAIEQERDLYQKTGAASRVARGITTLAAAKMQGQQATTDGGKAISAPETIGTAGRENVKTNLLGTTTTAREIDSTAVTRVGVVTTGKATTTEDLKIPGWGIKGTAKVKVDRTTTPGENNPRATAAPGTTAGASRATQS